MKKKTVLLKLLKLILSKRHAWPGAWNDITFFCLLVRPQRGYDGTYMYMCLHNYAIVSMYGYCCGQQSAECKYARPG